MPRTACLRLKLDGTFMLYALLKLVPKIHVKHVAWIMPLILSALMSGTLSLFNLIRNQGFHDHFLHKWLLNWSLSWLIAFPLILIFAPIVKKLLNLVTYK